MPRKSDTCIGKVSGEPLSVYESKYEADEAAEYANTQYDNNLSPYQCTKCGEWHLAPQNRHTPNSKCHDCKDSNGNLKALYETRETAQRRADILAEERNVNLSVYPCPYNAGWHLTSK